MAGGPADGDDSGDEAELAQAYAAQRLLAASQARAPHSAGGDVNGGGG